MVRLVSVRNRDCQSTGEKHGSRHIAQPEQDWKRRRSHFHQLRILLIRAIAHDLYWIFVIGLAGLLAGPG
jgi:hypothetical protein